MEGGGGGEEIGAKIERERMGLSALFLPLTVKSLVLFKRKCIILYI